MPTARPPTLIFGRGYLGGAFAGAETFAPAVLSSADVTDPKAVDDEVARYRPAVIINAAGKTSLEWCRDHEDDAARVNVDGALHLLAAAQRHGARLVHLGSACIFDQERGPPAPDGYTEDDPPLPQCAYTLAKARADTLLQERGPAHLLLIRLRQPFSRSAHPRNLITKLVEYRQFITSQNSMTYVPDLIAAVRFLLDGRNHGVFHVCNPGTLSPFEIGVMAHRILGLPETPLPISKAELDALDRQRGRERRVDAVVSSSKLARLGFHMPGVRQRMEEALRGYGRA